MTDGTLVPNEAATAGAIGPRTREFEPITATHPVRRYASAGIGALGLSTIT